MSWIAAFLLAIGSGAFLAVALTNSVWRADRLWAILGALSLATLLGPGLASIGFFAASALGAGSPSSAWILLAVLVLACALAWWRMRPHVTISDAHPHKFPWTWALAVALTAACLILALDFQAASHGNPDGEWDASAIWNLRARFLAGGPEVWHRAVGAEIGGFMTGSSHPGYPLFLSSFVALLWAAAGNTSTAVPMTVSFVIALALVLLLAASVARRSPPLGLLAGLVLLATELFASQAAAQYSDLLLGLAFLAALVLLDAASAESTPSLLIAAGLAIGLAPWIKNEGEPFAIAALAVAAWKFRGKVAWLLAGAAPGLLATAALKSMAEGREAMFPATLGAALTKIADPSRWLQSLAGFGKAVLDAGPPWAHPVLLVAALALVLQFIPASQRRARLWLAIPIAVTLAAEFGLFLITTADLAWHISTSVERLLAQVWPSLLWLVFSMLRTPEEYFATLPEPISGKRKRAITRV